jgi:hypothetical protein
VGEEPVRRGVVDVGSLRGVPGGRGADERLERLPTNAEVDAEDARAVQVRGGLKAVVVVGDDRRDGHPAVGRIVVGVEEEERVPHATSGAPFRLPAVTATTPGMLVATAMISSVVMRASCRGPRLGRRAGASCRTGVATWLARQELRPLLAGQAVTHCATHAALDSAPVDAP